ncbi:MAG: serine hydrolase, partial [Phenylobacterium sp.]|nr:serine hydrolase [Phenylobacterium sp.]
MALAGALAVGSEAQAQAPDREGAYAKLDAIFADFARERSTPGLVYGVVADGRLVYVKALGVQDTAAQRPVTAD